MFNAHTLYTLLAHPHARHGQRPPEWDQQQCKYYCSVKQNDQAALNTAMQNQKVISTYKQIQYFEAEYDSLYLPPLN